ncbi:hypothetical protein SAMN05428988_0160 [Chitinophaga sp. YR573]|nr:hypothetical protein SAMN05428988_0160 [Chitinophaga sp. YR573]
MLSATIPQYKKDSDDIDDEDAEELSGSNLSGFLGL